jgi:hypothetical protein
LFSGIEKESTTLPLTCLSVALILSMATRGNSLPAVVTNARHGADSSIRMHFRSASSTDMWPHSKFERAEITVKLENGNLGKKAYESMVSKKKLVIRYSLFLRTIPIFEKM